MSIHSVNGQPIQFHSAVNDPTTQKVEELPSVSSEPIVAQFSNLSIAKQAATAKQEEDKKVAQAIPTNVDKPKTMTEADKVKYNKLLLEFNKYFKHYDLDIFTDFRNCQVQKIIAFALVDLLSFIHHRVCEKFREDATRLKNAERTVLHCIFALYRELKPTDVLQASFPSIETKINHAYKIPLNEAFIELIRLDDEFQFKEHLETILALLEFECIHELISNAETSVHRNKDKVLSYISTVTAKVDFLIKVHVEDLYNQYSVRFSEYSSGAIHLLKALKASTAISSQEISPVDMATTSLSVILLVSSILPKHLEEQVQLGFGISSKPLQTLVNFVKSAHLLLIGLEKLKKGQLVISSALEASILPVLQGVMVNLNADLNYYIALYERRISISCVFYYPIIKNLLRELCDWQDVIDWDVPIAEKLIQEPEIPEIEDEVQPQQIEQKPKSKKKKPAKNLVKVTKPEQTHPLHLKGISTKEPTIPAAIQFFLNLKDQTLKSIGLDQKMAPADLTKLALSRSARARANQSHSLGLHAQAMEMLQHRHCYDQKSGSLNSLGRTILRFSALHASIACEQCTSAKIFEQDANAVVPHDQAVLAEMLQQNPKHSAIMLLGREPLLYRYPKTKKESQREELLSTWPNWLGYVASKLLPSEVESKEQWELSKSSDPITTSATAEQYVASKLLSSEAESKEQWELSKSSDPITTSATAEQLVTLNQKERELQALQGEIARLEHQKGEQEIALIGINKHLNDVGGFLQGITMMGHQRFMDVLQSGIFLGLQTLLEHTWIFSLVKQGGRNIVITRADDLHNIKRHLDRNELGSNLSDSEKTTLSLLHGPKAFELLAGHCAERTHISKLPQMLSDATLLANATGDTQSIWTITNKPGFDTEDAIKAKQTEAIDQIIVLINTVCKVIRQDVLG